MEDVDWNRLRFTQVVKTAMWLPRLELLPKTRAMKGKKYVEEVILIRRQSKVQVLNL